MLVSRCPRAVEAKFRLLYVGTDLELAAAVRQVLTEPDYHLVTCGDRGSAVLFLKSGIPYELLLIDLEWRGSEGVKIAELARSLPHRKRMPIILLAATKSTTHPETLVHLAQTKKVSKAGVVEIVTRTKDMVSLATVVTRLLVRNRKGR